MDNGPFVVAWERTEEIVPATPARSVVQGVIRVRNEQCDHGHFDGFKSSQAASESELCARRVVLRA